MPVTVTEMEATLRLRDQLLPQVRESVRAAKAEIKTLGDAASAVAPGFQQVSTAAKAAAPAVQQVAAQAPALQQVAVAAKAIVPAVQQVSGAATAAAPAFQNMATQARRSLTDVTVDVMKTQREITELKRLINENTGAPQFLKALTGELVDAQQKLRGYQDELKKLSGGASDAGSKVGGLSGAVGGANRILGAFGITLGAAAAINFGKTLIDDAAALVKLSEKTGVSIEWLQKFKAVGDDAGNTVEEITGAITIMQDRLVDGTEGTHRALEKLNLSWVELRSLKPEEQLVKISDAMREVIDPAERADLAKALFGPGGAAILPTLVKGFNDVKDASVGMSDTTALELERIGNNLSKLGRVAKNFASDMLASIPIAFRAVFDGASITREHFERLDAETKKQLAAVAKIPAPGTTTGPTIDPKELQDRVAKAAEEAGRKSEAAAKKAATEAARWAEKMREAKAAAEALEKGVVAIDTATVALIRHHIAEGDAMEEVAKAYNLSATTIKTVVEWEKQYQIASDITNRATQITAETFRGMNEEGIRAQKTLEEQVAWRQRLTSLERDVPMLNQRIAETMRVAGQETHLWGQKIEILPEKHRKNIRAQEEWRASIHALVGEIAVLAQVSGESFAGIARSVGQAVVAFDNVSAALKRAADAETRLGRFAGRVGAVVSGVSSVIAATGGESRAANIAGGAMAGAGAGLAVGTAWGALGGPPGMAIGAGVGAAVGFFRSLGADVKAANEILKEYVRTFGELGSIPGMQDDTRRNLQDINRLMNEGVLSIEQVKEQLGSAGIGFLRLREQAEAAGVSLDRLLAARSADEIKAAISELSEAIAHLNEIKQGASLFGPSSEQLGELAKKAKEVYEYMLKEGTYTAEQLAEAFKASVEAQARAAGDPAQQMRDKAAAAGFQTREELRKAADEARKLAEYMRDSGEFSAEAIEEAFDRADEAADKAFGKQTQRLSALREQYDTLAKAVAEEAPEAVMGVIEQQQRAQMEALDAQIKAQEEAARAAADAAASVGDQLGNVYVAHSREALDAWLAAGGEAATGWTAQGSAAAVDTTAQFEAAAAAARDAWAASAAAAASDVTGAFHGISIHVPIVFDIPNLPSFVTNGGLRFGEVPEPGEPGYAGPFPQAAGGDYYVDRPTLFIAGEAGPEYARFSGANKPMASGTTKETPSLQMDFRGAVILDGPSFQRFLKDRVWSRLPDAILHDESGIRRVLARVTEK